VFCFIAGQTSICRCCHHHIYPCADHVVRSEADPVGRIVGILGLSGI
jgi:hypothetical protein